MKEAGDGRKEDTHAHMPLHQLRELQRFIAKYQDCVTRCTREDGLVEHVILTRDANPIRLPPYRLPHKSQEMLRKR